MKTKLTLLIILAIFTAQITAGQDVKTETISFQVSPVKANVSDLIEYERRNPVKVEVPDLSKKMPKTGYPADLALPDGAKIIPFSGVSNTNSPDPVPTPNVPSPAPSLTFESLIDNISSIPPDVQGVVGPNHIFTVLNSQYRYHNRTTGATLSTVTPNTFWSPTGKTGIFDPNMVYDPFNNRWIFAICARTNPESFILIAVSQTNDPTGTWNYYTIDVDANNVNWFDYPSLGFNKDWIVVGGNMFSNAANAFAGVQIYAFDKATMYAGGTLDNTKFTLFATAGSTIGATHTPAYTYDNTLNKIYLLQHWNSSLATWRMWEITGTTHPLTMTSLGFPTNNSAWSGAGILASQPTVAASQYIDAGDTRMQNVVYRNGKLWGTQGIFLPSGSAPTRASCQTWEINPTGLVVNQSIRIDDNDGVAPQEHFYYPSIAVNASNDLLMGFAHSSVNHFAGGMYALRKGTDASGTIRENVRFANGLATYYKTYSGTRNRWGDYTATVVDPVNDTDFWTIQEFASTNNGTYDRWSTQWAKVIPPATNAITTNAPSSLTLCAGKNYNLTFTAAGVYNTGNVFTAQLATSSTFVSPTTIGTVTSTTASTITINVPTSIAPTGNNYRIRVIASNPSTTSGNNIAVTVISTNLTVSSATTAPFEAVENIDNSGVMNPTGNVSYKSGKSITLSSGTSPTKNFTFNSTGGNVFEAKIQACPY